jgi:hypothetical protein
MLQHAHVTVAGVARTALARVVRLSQLSLFTRRSLSPLREDTFAAYVSWRKLFFVHGAAELADSPNENEAPCPKKTKDLQQEALIPERSDTDSSCML